MPSNLERRIPLNNWSCHGWHYNREVRTKVHHAMLQRLTIECSKAREGCTKAIKAHVFLVLVGNTMQILSLGYRQWSLDVLKSFKCLLVGIAWQAGLPFPMLRLAANVPCMSNAKGLLEWEGVQKATRLVNLEFKGATNRLGNSRHVTRVGPMRRRYSASARAEVKTFPRSQCFLRIPGWYRRKLSLSLSAWQQRDAFFRRRKPSLEKGELGKAFGITRGSLSLLGLGCFRKVIHGERGDSLSRLSKDKCFRNKDRFIEGCCPLGVSQSYTTYEALWRLDQNKINL